MIVSIWRRGDVRERGRGIPSCYFLGVNRRGQVLDENWALGFSIGQAKHKGGYATIKGDMTVSIVGDSQTTLVVSERLIESVGELNVAFGEKQESRIITAGR